MAKSRDQWALPSHMTDGYCRVVGLTEVAKSWDSWMLLSHIDRLCQFAGPTNITELRD